MDSGSTIGGSNPSSPANLLLAFIYVLIHFMPGEPLRSQDDLPEFSFQAARDRAIEKQALTTLWNEFWFQVIQEAARDLGTESLGDVIRSKFIDGMTDDPKFELYKRRAIRGVEYDATEDLLRRAKQTGEPIVIDESVILEAIEAVGTNAERRDAYIRDGEDSL